MQVSYEGKTLRKDRRRCQTPLEALFRELLALFDKVVASAISLSARNDDPSHHFTARILDDYLFELRLWPENIKTMMPDAELTDSLKLLRGLEESTASNLRDILSNLERDLTSLSAKLTDSQMYDRVTSHMIFYLGQLITPIQDV